MLSTDANSFLYLVVAFCTLFLMAWSLWRYGLARPQSVFPGRRKVSSLFWKAPTRAPVKVDWQGFPPGVVRAHLDAFNAMLGKDLLVAGRELEEDEGWYKPGVGFIRVLAEVGATKSDVHLGDKGVFGVTVKLNPWLLREDAATFSIIFEHELGMALGLGPLDADEDVVQLRNHRLTADDVSAIREAYFPAH